MNNFFRQRSGRKLVLHVGMHKTGTTSIQNFLEINSRFLRLRGYECPLMPGRPINFGQLVGRRRNSGVLDFFVRDVALKELTEKILSTKANIVISSEDLSFLGGKEIEKLSTALSNHFSSIHIIFYLRRQDRMAISLKAQGARTMHQMELCGSSDHPLPKMSARLRQYLEYDGIIKAWREFFQKSRITCINYDVSAEKRINSVKYFKKLTGLWGFKSRHRLNQAMDSDQVRYIWFLRRLGLGPGNLRIAGAKFQSFQCREETFLPSQAEAKDFMGNFSASNERLRAITQGDISFDSDFSDYPVSRNYTALRDDLLIPSLKAASVAEGLSDPGRAAIVAHLNLLISKHY